MFATLLASMLSAVVAAPGDRVAQAADKLIDQINAKQDTAIWDRFAPAMQNLMPKDKAGAFFNDVRKVGRITKVQPVMVDAKSGQFRLMAEHGGLDLRLALDDNNRISGLMIRPAGEDLAPPGRTTTPMRLPFKGTWTVVWGGPTKEQNAHHDVPNQRRALDIVITGMDGKSYTGDGKQNEDYLCYGREVLAPAPGTVVMAIDGVPDNAPGSMNSFMATGNCVMIRQAPNEYSVIAHLQPRTLKVKVGDKVKAGQLLGLCGNSGNSSEPHLHFHAQDAEVFQDGLGLTPYFEYVRLTRNHQIAEKKDYTPVKDDKIGPT